MCLGHHHRHREDQKTAIAGGTRIELAWLEDDLAGVRSIGADLLEVAVRASHGNLRGEVLRYLRRAGEPVEPFPGRLPAFAAGISGDWATAARLWEETGNPYHQALKLTESPEWRWPPTSCGSSTASGRSAAARLVRRQLREGGVRSLPRGRRRPPGPTRAADRPPARGPGPARRRPHQRRDRRAPLPVATDRQQPRGRPARPAGGRLPLRRRRCGRRPRPARPREREI